MKECQRRHLRWCGILAAPKTSQEPVTLPTERDHASHANQISTIEGGMHTTEEKDAHIDAGCEVQNVDTYELMAPSKPLSSLLDKHGLAHIGPITLGVEGYTLSVSTGHDLSWHKPCFLPVEARHHDGTHEYLSGLYDVTTGLSFHDLLCRLEGDALQSNADIACESV